MSAKTNSERVFGIALGINGGILVLSLLYVYSRTMLFWFTFITFGALLIVPLLLGALAGIWAYEKGYFRGRGWLATTVVVLLGWPAAVLAPPELRILHAHRLAQELVIYPNAEVKTRNVTPFDSDNGPAHLSVLMRAPASRDEVVRYYRDQLSQRRWKETRLPGWWKFHQPDLYFRRHRLTLEVYVQPEEDMVSSTVEVVCQF